MGQSYAAELILGVLLLMSGGFGFPMGTVPAPEDPAMYRVAPEDCILYAS